MCVYCLGAVVDIFERVSVCVLLRGSGGHLCEGQCVCTAYGQWWTCLRGSVCVYCLGAVVDIFERVSVCTAYGQWCMDNFEMVSVCVLLRGSGGHRCCKM